MLKEPVYLLIAAVLVWGGVTLHRNMKRDPDLRMKDWHPACRTSVRVVPKEGYLRFATIPSRYKPKLRRNKGTCVAKQVGEGLVLTQGVIISDAMRLQGVPPIVFEAYLLEDRKRDEKTVRAYGPLYDACVFRVDGIVSFPRFPPHACLEVAGLMRFDASAE